MKKKLLCAIFAATMLFGASMTVFAVSDNDTSGNDVEETVSGGNAIGKETEITMNAEVTSPTLEVTITRGTKVIANPYGLDVNTVSGGDPVTDSLVGSTIKFENKSNTPIAVGLKGQVKVKEGSNVKVVTTKPSVSSPPKDKTVFIEAEITKDGTADNKLLTSTEKVEKNLVYSATGAKQTNIPVLAAEGKAGAKESSEITLVLKGNVIKLS